MTSKNCVIILLLDTTPRTRASKPMFPICRQPPRPPCCGTYKWHSTKSCKYASIFGAWPSTTVEFSTTKLGKQPNYCFTLLHPRKATQFAAKVSSFLALVVRARHRVGTHVRSQRPLGKNMKGRKRCKSFSILRCLEFRRVLGYSIIYIYIYISILLSYLMRQNHSWHSYLF